MIVQSGLTQFAYWLGGSTALRPSNVGVGLGTTAATTATSALNNEVYPTTSRNTTTKLLTRNNIITYRMSEALTEGSTGAYAEMGLFTNSTTGTMISMITHPDLNKTDKIAVENFITLEMSSYLP